VKGKLIEQYDLTLTKLEMRELMIAVRRYVAEFEASPLAEEMLENLEELYQGGGDGIGVEWPLVDDADDEEPTAGDEPAAA